MNRSAQWGAAILGGLLLGVLLVPAIMSSDPLAIGEVLSSRFIPPGGSDGLGRFHLLGTDRFGRDLFLRMMLAGRVSLAVGVTGSLLASALGVAIGAAAAWRGGLVDRVAMGLTDALLAIPRLILLLLCAALWQPGLTTVVVVLVATGWMGVARLVRSEVLGIRERPYIEAGRALGVRPWRLVVRHVLPNAMGPAIVATTLGVGSAILLESGLSFLGMGIQPPYPSWGNMIAGGRDVIVSAPWVAIAPGLALMLTVLGSTLLGDSLRDRLAGAVRNEPIS